MARIDRYRLAEAHGELLTLAEAVAWNLMAVRTYTVPPEVADAIRRSLTSANSMAGVLKGVVIETTARPVMGKEGSR